MRNLQKLSFFLIGLSFFSCQKENSDANPGDSTCKVVKTYLYDFGQLDDSVFNTYSSEKLIKVTLGNEYRISFTYEGNKIVRRDYFDLSTNAPDGYSVISYNSDGTINKIEEYETANGQTVVDWTYRFSYTSGKLTTLTLLDDQSQPFEEYIYTYSGNNISKTEYIDDPGGTSMHYITEWKYDNLKNAYSSNQQALLADGLLLQNMGDYAAFCLSANNVTEISYDNYIDPVVYTRDAQNNITEIKLAGSLFSKNVYECR
jgi:hypothetical protein